MALGRVSMVVEKFCCLDIPMMEVNEKLRIRIILSFFSTIFYKCDPLMAST